MFKDDFERLCKERGISPSKALVDLGMSKSSYSKWNTGSYPHNKSLKKIAEYFNISIEHLILGQKNNLADNISEVSDAALLFDKKLKEHGIDSSKLSISQIDAIVTLIKGIANK